MAEIDVSPATSAIVDGISAVLAIMVSLFTAYAGFIGIRMVLDMVRDPEESEDDYEEEDSAWMEEEMDSAYAEYSDSQYADTMDFNDWYEEYYR